MTTYTRKNFLKIFGLGIGAALTATVSPLYAAIDENTKVDTEKKDFLKEYSDWLTEFQHFVNKRNINAEDIDNNKRLMELSAQAEQRKPMLENFMKNEEFALLFNRITVDITTSI